MLNFETTLEKISRNYNETSMQFFRCFEKTFKKIRKNFDKTKEILKKSYMRVGQEVMS